ncbi:unnamed protein product [Arabidopsis thaliana]|uniref:Uncharacterized protein n=1 Tax=Arabidopsis thaliana TaxID=3702 RepID=A0A654FD47_ARATH|nr:unnamed protein product [Arabidopsis thaliana]
MTWPTSGRTLAVRAGHGSSTRPSRPCLCHRGSLTLPTAGTLRAYHGHTAGSLRAHCGRTGAYYGHTGPNSGHTTGKVILKVRVITFFSR